jgi:Xaa-Pro aminopeptidase
LHPYKRLTSQKPWIDNGDSVNNNGTLGGLVDKSILVSRLAQLSIDRLARVREHMARDQVDTLVVASQENVMYTTGYESMGATINRRFTWAAVITPDRVLLVAPAAEFAPAIDAGLLPDNIFTFGTFFFSGDSPSSHTSVQSATFEIAFGKALAGLRPKRVVAENMYLPGSIQAALPAPVADAASWMLNVRARKLPFEIELMRKVTEITQKAINAGIASARIGMTDKDVARVVASEMSLGGGLPRNLTVVGGHRSALADVMSSERVLKPGDLLRFDVGCSLYGYKSDMARTAVVGEPTKLQSSRYAAILAGLEAELEFVKAGVVARDVFHHGVAAVEAHGLAPYQRQHIGHAIGISVYEWPVITPDCTEPLQAGSTFCLETPFYEPGWGGMMAEETGVVTESGFELFSTIDRSLRVIPD